MVDLAPTLRDEREDLPGDVALHAPSRFELGRPLADSPRDIGLGPEVSPKPADGNDMKRAVGCAVSPAVNPMANILPEEAGTGLTPQSAAKLASECRRSGVVACRQQQLRGGLVTDGVPRHKCGSELIDDGGDHRIKVGDFVMQFEVASSKGLQCDRQMPPCGSRSCPGARPPVS